MKSYRGAHPDKTLTHTLRAMGATLDPIPDELVAAAIAAFSCRTVDKEPAALAYDSLLDDAPTARPPGGGRHLSFVGRHLSVEVDVGTDGLTGRLVPPAVADVELRWPGGSTTLAVDGLGGFSVSPIPTGPVSLRCQPGLPDTTSPVVTDWVTL